MHVFVLLGLLQLALAHHARLTAEYAAYKAARAASLYRLDCGHVTRAALVALAPTLPGKISGDVRAAYEDRLRTIAGPGGNASRVHTPLTLVSYQLERGGQRRFDDPLDVDAAPMKVHVRLAYFFEYRIPFANWILARYWLAMHGMLARWAELDPTLPVREAEAPMATGGVSFDHLVIARTDLGRGYFTAPIITSWTMRMMSDPLPGLSSRGQCR